LRSVCGTLLGIAGTPLIYGVVMSLSEFSNAELITHLRGKMKDLSWTPAEFIEAERRGENCLDADPELATAFWAERDRVLAPAVAAFRAAYEPTRQALAKLAGKITPPEVPEMLSLSDIPDIDGIRHDQLIAVLERTDSRLANIEEHTRRDWVFWVQFVVVLIGAGAAIFALFA
jgi:hypothetical protein